MCADKGGGALTDYVNEPNAIHRVDYAAGANVSLKTQLMEKKEHA
jgi:hypothetical protein